jgi:hypothetical protein
MSHEIEKPIDKVLSTKGVEWHGLADVVEVINRQTLIDQGLFPELKSSQVINFTGGNVLEALAAIGETVKKIGVKNEAKFEAFQAFASQFTTVDSHQTILADYTACRPDLVEAGLAIVPMGIPKQSYGMISNERLFNVLESALPDCKLVNAGTLRAGKVVFYSLDLGQVEYIGPRGDKFMQYLDCISSHDGTLGARFYDSGTRIVCMNTLKASLANRGNLDQVVYHTVNAESALNRVAVNLADIFAARVEYFNTLGYLDTVSISQDEAMYYMAALLTSWNVRDPADYSNELSAQAFNKCEEIREAFKMPGMGTAGANLYDLFNAVTYVYTWGSGTGKNTGKADKFLKSMDGTPNEIKNFALNFLQSDSETLGAHLARGEKLYKEYAAAKSAK